MTAWSESFVRDVPVRCANEDCRKEYTATQTVRDFYSDEGDHIGRNEEPVSGLCPRCKRPAKEILG